jgi:hypothetical protein
MQKPARKQGRFTQRAQEKDFSHESHESHECPCKSPRVSKGDTSNQTLLPSSSAPQRLRGKNILRIKKARQKTGPLPNFIPYPRRQIVLQRKRRQTRRPVSMPSGLGLHVCGVIIRHIVYLTSKDVNLCARCEQGSVTPVDASATGGHAPATGGHAPATSGHAPATVHLLPLGLVAG